MRASDRRAIRKAKVLLICLFLSLLMMGLVAGCAPKPVVYRSVELTVPPRLPLPTVQAAELACLSDSTYERLANRQRLMEEMVTVCEATVRSTQEAE